MTKFLLSFLILSLSSSFVFATPSQVLIIRHAEKPDTGDDLSPQGYKRAQALVKYFQTNPAVTKYGTPAAIYAMGSSGSLESSNRPVETVAPLAKALNLPLHSKYTREEIQPLVNEILNVPEYNGKMVLICWEHKMIPSIVKEFGLTKNPGTWPGAIFSQVWELDFSGGSIIGFHKFSQGLFPGDR